MGSQKVKALNCALVGRYGAKLYPERSVVTECKLLIYDRRLAFQYPS